MSPKDEELRLRILYQQLKKKLAESFDIHSILFKDQLDFVKDPAKRKYAICSRRAGKSLSMAADLISSIQESFEGDCAYIGLTRGTAKKVMFNQILKLRDKYSLKITENRSELTFTDDKTKNTLYITGANSEDDAEKLRGLKLKKVVLDEVASFRAHLNYLIEEVIEPTLIDTDGTLILIGTPSANPTDENYFFKVSQGIESGWSGHRWTIVDNPHIPHAKKWLDEYRVRKNWDVDNPVYMREWLGQWTFDTDSLVYKYNKAINDYDKLPHDDNWLYVLGIDLGFEDAFAIAVLAFSYTQTKVYLVDEFKKSHMLPADMAREISKMKAKWNPIKSVADCGGLGKAIVEEFNARYMLSIEPAEKNKKQTYIELLNGDLRTGLLKIKYETEAVREMLVHQWDPDKPGKEDDRTDNHLLDSLLYAWRLCKHYLGETVDRKPEVGSTEFYDLEAKRMLELELEAYENQQNEIKYR